MTKLLLQHGAKVDATSSEFRPRTALPQSCAVISPGAVKMVSIFLAGFESRCEDGRSALHLATKHPTHVAKLILGAGANVNLQAKGGCTPLHDVAVENNQEIIALLISHQAF